MAEYSSILSLLEAERERYVLEADSLERRLKFVHNQMNALDALISGYATEEQIYSTSRGLSNFQSQQPILPVGLTPFGEEDSASSYKETETPTQKELSSKIDEITEKNFPASDSVASITTDKPKDSSASVVDISDIPKLVTARKPGTVPLLEEFQEYSVQNAILILMRRRPDLHMHIDAIIRDLYGNLPPDEAKKARSSVTSALSAGSIQGLWYRVLRTNGVYTLHYDKGVTASPKGRK
jgi:hypothetical protein